MNRCLIGDCRDVMRELIAEGVKVNMCVTSPPYWGLRDYGTAQWEDANGECDHVAGMARGDTERETPGGRGGSFRGGEIQFRDLCAKCGAKRIDRQFGLEPTIDEYVANMVEVFRLVHELLADDGTLWLNLGDSYAGSGMTGGTNSINGSKRNQEIMFNGHHRDSISGVKTKDLCGIPWRVAFALQADGWYLRQDIIWAKPNPMPESVTDRCTKAHEYVFLLSKRERYYFDQEAIREKNGNEMSWEQYERRQAKWEHPAGLGFSVYAFDGKKDGGMAHPNGRNRRSIWTIPSEPYPESHFATFPQALVEPCVMAGTSEKGHCPQCGKGWGRMVERESFGKAFSATKFDETMQGGPLSRSRQAYRLHGLEGPPPAQTLGWQPTCACGLVPAPAIVFDPFLGSGTVGQVAERLGRRWLGIELNPVYGELAKQRTAQMGLQLSAS